MKNEVRGQDLTGERKEECVDKSTVASDTTRKLQVAIVLAYNH